MKDRTGEKYSKLTVLRFSRREGKRYFWIFKCDCGNEKELVIECVAWAKYPVTSCGCSSRQQYYGLQAIQYSVFARGYSDGNLTFEKFVELSQQPCFYCGKLPENSNFRRKRKRVENKTQKGYFEFHYNGLDRVDNTKPHDEDNVVPCCFRCNSWKQNLTLDEFKEIIVKIHNKLNKST